MGNCGGYAIKWQKTTADLTNYLGKKWQAKERKEAMQAVKNLQQSSFIVTALRKNRLAQKAKPHHSLHQHFNKQQALVWALREENDDVGSTLI